MSWAFHAELGIDAQPIVVAEFGDLSAIYDVRESKYIPEDCDELEGGWPEPPAEVIAQAKDMALR